MWVEAVSGCVHVCHVYASLCVFARSSVCYVCLSMHRTTMCLPVDPAPQLPLPHPLAYPLHLSTTQC